MQLSLFEMVKHGTSTIIEIVDSFARTKIDELNAILSAKQNITDNALTTTAKTIVGAIDEVNEKAEDNTDAILRINSDLTAYTDHATQVGIFNTPLISTTDGWFCVYGRSASGNFVEVLDGTSPMWSGFLYSDGTHGSCSPLLIERAGHTYSLNVVSGGSYDTHFVVYR